MSKHYLTITNPIHTNKAITKGKYRFSHITLNSTSQRNRFIRTKTRAIEKVLVTGGASFIGSHLVDTLITQGAKVCVFNNLTNRTLQNIKPWLNNPNLTFIKDDILNPTDLKKLKNNHHELIFHLAANPEVRVGSTNPKIHFQQNLVATQNLLEHIRKSQSNPKIIFTSTSTVYGEPTKIPTPENYSPPKNHKPNLRHYVPAKKNNTKQTITINELLYSRLKLKKV